MTTTTQTTMHTPWGWTQDIEALAEGVWRVTTPSHGGLKLSRERWNALPGCVRDAMLPPTFAEEDCEEVIVRTLLGLGDERGRELALKVAGYFDRYAPALPHLRTAAPGPHYHVIAYWGGYGTDPFERFDTRSRPSPSWATPRWRGPTGSWRLSSAAGRSRSAGGKGAGHDHDD